LHYSWPESRAKKELPGQQNRMCILLTRSKWAAKRGVAGLMNWKCFAPVAGCCYRVAVISIIANFYDYDILGASASADGN